MTSGISNHIHMGHIPENEHSMNSSQDETSLVEEDSEKQVSCPGGEPVSTMHNKPCPTSKPNETPTQRSLFFRIRNFISFIFTGIKRLFLGPQMEDLLTPPSIKESTTSPPNQERATDILAHAISSHLFSATKPEISRSIDLLASYVSKHIATQIPGLLALHKKMSALPDFPAQKEEIQLIESCSDESLLEDIVKILPALQSVTATINTYKINDNISSQTHAMLDIYKTLASLIKIQMLIKETIRVDDKLISLNTPPAPSIDPSIFKVDDPSSAMYEMLNSLGNIQCDLYDGSHMKASSAYLHNATRLEIATILAQNELAPDNVKSMLPALVSTDAILKRSVTRIPIVQAKSKALHKILLNMSTDESHDQILEHIAKAMEICARDQGIPISMDRQREITKALKNDLSDWINQLLMNFKQIYSSTGMTNSESDKLINLVQQDIPEILNANTLETAFYRLFPSI